MPKVRRKRKKVQQKLPFKEHAPKKQMIGEQIGQVFLGIDPGKQGGLATVTQAGTLVSYDKMPETERELWNLVSGMKGVSRAYLEKVRAMPKQSPNSMFTFGWGYGTLRMALVAAGIPFEDVTPQAWQKGLAIPPRNKKRESAPMFKERLRVKAQSFYPLIHLWDQPKSKGLQMAVCDAMLIAEYGRRTFSGYAKV